MYEDLHKSRYEAFTTEIGLLYSSIRLITKNLKKWAKPQRVPTRWFFSAGKAIFITTIRHGINYRAGSIIRVNLIFEPLIGAISGGNCAVIKPAQMTPNVSKVVAKSSKRTSRKINPGYRRRPASYGCADQCAFDYLFFTGSVSTGKMVMTAATKIWCR